MISVNKPSLAPRRSHDRERSVSPNLEVAPDRHRRSSSDATPRPTPASNARPLAEAAHPDSLQPQGGASRRLGFFGTEKQPLPSASSSSNLGHPSQSTSGASLRPVPSSLLPPRSHSRADSALAVSRDAAASPVPAGSSSNPNAGKGHTSPSKASTRTYDSKLVSREMHRLGNLAHLPAPLLSAATSASSLALAAPSNMSSSGLSSASLTNDNPWGALHVHVLPLFNGEPLRIPIEDLNTLVKRQIQAVVSVSPSKALSTLQNDTAELIAAGMVTLNAKLLEIDDDKLLHRVVEIWGFFWDQVLPYVEGVLLPLQTDPLLFSLYRTPKGHRAPSPSRQKQGSMSSMIALSTPHIDVRTVALRSFRDRIILPLFPRLHARLSTPSRQDDFAENSAYQQPRLQQMLLVLNSQGGRPRPPSFSLTSPSPSPQPSSGEMAVSDLLHVLRHPPRESQHPNQANLKRSMALSPTPSFLSGGLPRDRRGRIAQKAGSWMPAEGFGLDGAQEDEDGHVEDEYTPRSGQAERLADAERERERMFLEGLRSPDIEGPGHRVSVGGWGLGAGNEDVGRAPEEDDDDDALDWDQAQAVVERMVGMKGNERDREAPPPEREAGRRRMT
ncbi:hypothetical protein PLICRDRAFT_50655 [Plicaturopsis crispa FD-325 SS-3]|nr:hypothetical protein PLICRDRAFT_50655 [Plicaturopsis crispa FD-325 SS-3]